MKKSELKKIIKEEITSALSEGYVSSLVDVVDSLSTWIHLDVTKEQIDSVIWALAMEYNTHGDDVLNKVNNLIKNIASEHKNEMSGINEVSLPVVDRMEGLVNIEEKSKFITLANSIAQDLDDEGFEIQDIKDYLKIIIQDEL